MAMELHVLSDQRLNSIAEWQRAIGREGYPLHLDGNTQLGAVKGFLPATMNRKQTGFECYHDDALETMSFLGNDQFGHRWKYSFGFRWRGSSFEELDASWMAATAYAAATGGIIFDHEEGRVFTAQQARELVAKFVSERPQTKARMEKILQRLAKSRGT
jgi:hypothetical protein